MTPQKRLFDITVALLLSLVFAPILLGLLAWMALKEGRPLFYISERMIAPGRPFMLWKLRSMREVDGAGNSGVSGGDKSARISPTGAFLRSSRLDEIPQLWNVLKGDISLVGPRPPLRRYVENHPEIYAQVLKNRPGITGMATVFYHRHEGILLAKSTSATETEAIYSRRAVPRKARLDLLYQKHGGFCMDLWILYLTATKLLPLPGRRAQRLRAK